MKTNIGLKAPNTKILSFRMHPPPGNPDTVSSFRSLHVGFPNMTSPYPESILESTISDLVSMKADVI